MDGFITLDVEMVVGDSISITIWLMYNILFETVQVGITDQGG